MNAVPEQKRADVRGTMTLAVKYKTLTREEYENQKDSIEQVIFQDEKKLKIETGDADDRSNAVIPNPWIVDFLFQLDEKMDRILDLLSDEKKTESQYADAVGLDISGSGMKLKVNRAVESGEILHMRFILSQFPYVRMNLFGVVKWNETVKDQDGEARHLGIEFLLPDETVREQIISKVFQMQRKALRQRSNDQ